MTRDEFTVLYGLACLCQDHVQTYNLYQQTLDDRLKALIGDLPKGFIADRIWDSAKLTESDMLDELKREGLDVDVQ